ncbi:hypothetical protein [Roseateles sp.]|uniref:hypothetical protein n=1 Tax=Roseateles sp. TaxID=1971397 RepID=UPI0031DB4130
MHKSRNLSDRMMLRTYFGLYRAGLVERAEYMGVQARYRPSVQPREPAEPFRGSKAARAQRWWPALVAPLRFSDQPRTFYTSNEYGMESTALDHGATRVRLPRDAHHHFVEPRGKY